MNIPAELKYTKDHEWVRIEGNEAVIGITDFAQGELGDIVFVDIGTEGQEVEQHAVFGTVEAVKTVSDLFMPMKGTVLSVNPTLADDPAAVNKDPYGAGWMVRLRVSDMAQLSALLTAEQYKAVVGSIRRKLRNMRWALLWSLAILVLCLIPGASLPQWHWFDLFNLDKSVHAGMFFVLALLLARASQLNGTPRRYLLWAFLISACYGVCTELLQGLEALGRRTDPNDMLANAVGSALAIWFASWRMKRGRTMLPFELPR